MAPTRTRSSATEATTDGRRSAPLRRARTRGIAALGAALALALATGASAAAPFGPAPGSPSPWLAGAPGANPNANAKPAAGKVKAAPQRPRPEVDPDTILVRPRAGRRAAEALRAAGLTPGRRIPGTGYVVAGTRGGDAAGVLERVRRDPGVAAAQPNFIRRATAAPDDTEYARGRQGWMDTLRIPAAWDRQKATLDHVVAVLDTGVDTDHPDLAGRLKPGYDFVNEDAGAVDDEGHGTATASVAAARAGDAQGVAGVSHGGAVMPVKVLDAEGSGTDAQVASGITWAADHGARVINLSLGGPGSSDVLDQAVAHARAKGAVVVAAAGNSGSDYPEYPAASPGVLGTGATDWSGNLAWYSSYGPNVDLTAPGHRMRVARPAPDGEGSWHDADGTSFAAPVVAGAALLVAAQNPSWSAAQIEQRLLATARDAGPTGEDPYHGAGLVDPLAALGGPAAPPAAGNAADGDSAMDQATVLPAGGGGATSTLSREGDVDWYAVDAPRGIATVRIQPAPSGHEVERALRVDSAVDVYGADRRWLYTVDNRGIDYHDDAEIDLPTAGRYYFRVASRLPSRSNEPYTFSVGTLAAGVGSASWFTPPVAWALPESEVASTAVADVTGDGRAEVLTTTHSFFDSEHDFQLLVHGVDAEGDLEPPDILDTGGRTMWSSESGTLNSDQMGIATGDVDGDGRTDAVVAAGRWIAVFAQRSGRLAPAVPVPGSQGADAVELVDFDGDGRRDLVATINRDGAVEGEPRGVYAFLNRGSAGWERKALTGPLGQDVAVGDITGDGRLDLVGAHSEGLEVARQRADGTWGIERLSAPAAGSEGVEIADVTGDGRADVITVNDPFGGEPTLDVHAQTAAGALAPPRSTPTAWAASAVKTADVNGDGRRDVVMATRASWSVVTFLQRADGTLAEDEVYDLGTLTYYREPTALALGEVTGDKAPDVVVADSNYGTILLRQRTDDFPRPVWIRHASPADSATGVSASAAPAIRFGRALNPASVTAANVRLQTAAGAPVQATPAYDSVTRTLTVTPAAALAAGTRYVVRLDGVRDVFGGRPPARTGVRFTVGAAGAHDTTPPDTRIVSGPSGTVPEQGNSRFAYATDEFGATFECSLDGAAFAGCPPARTYHEDLAEGQHTFRVRAVDAAGRVDPTPAARTWTIRPPFTAPAPANDAFDAPRALSGASGTVRQSSVGATSDGLGPDRLALTRDDRGGRSVWFTWTAPAGGTLSAETAGSDFDTLLAVFTGPSQGDLRRRADSDDAPGVRTSRVALRVHAGVQYRIAVDGASDPAYAQSGAVVLGWTFVAGADSTAPDTAIESGPPALVTSGPATFAFSATERGSTFECEIDGSEWFACPSPVSFHQATGTHTLRVRAVDEAGNRDATPATRTWKADRIAPDTQFSSGPGFATTSPDATFAFTSNEAGATFECRLDRAAWSACASPHTVKGAAPGIHELDVRARDAAGHVDPEPARYQWTVKADTVAPQTEIASGPAGVARITTARFAFTASEAATFECRLDGGAWGACSTPKAYAGLAPGTHAFAVRARDGAGNLDASPATRTWTVDPSAPIVGDFDGDSHPDLAAGGPGEPIGGHAGAGAVTILYGAPGGVVASARSAVWSQGNSGIASDPEPGDEFGAALAAGDFDADGYDDLAVGAPGEDDGAGMVHVLRGSARGLTPSRGLAITRATAGMAGAPTAGDGLGAALASGRFDGGETDDLAVGAPGAPAAGASAAGAVHVLPGAAAAASRLFTRATDGVVGERGAGDSFGAALAAGDVGGDAHADLAIGAPGDDAGTRADAGAVNVLPGSAGGLSTAGDSLWTQDTAGVLDVAESRDRFGAALAIGALGLGGRGDLAVGAPGEPAAGAAGSGQVHLLYGTAGGVAADGNSVLTQSAEGVTDDPEPGDGFGAALTVSRPPAGTAPWLAVGSPGEDTGSAADAGAVHVFPPAGTGRVGGAGSRLSVQGAGGVLDQAEAGDAFGRALGSLGASLAVGVPGEGVGSAARAGAVAILPAGASGPAAAGNQLWTQQSTGVAGTSAAGDALGASLGG